MAPAQKDDTPRSYPALDELHAWLTANGAGTEPLRVAAAFLAMIRTKDWHDNPRAFQVWLEQLALDVARAWQSNDAALPRR
jgi:hypothetical protein